MTETMSSIPGFNVETMEGFKAFAAKNPNEVQLGVQAKALWTGRAGHTTAKIGSWFLGGQKIDKPSRDFSIQFGAWKEVEAAIGVEGADDKIEPVEAALAAMSACVNWAICINAAQQGISFDELEVSATTTFDPRVLLGILPIEDAPSFFENVNLTVAVRGENIGDDEIRRIEEMTNQSPVHAMIKYANTISTTVKAA